MNKINVLDKTIVNRISAGEVVENPASVVKELVENSIDAGATNILIEIENAGISMIKIVDNGCGMTADDLKTSILAHATSKIKSVEDLDKIMSLGFRGEALASIVAVSRAEITTSTSDQTLGSKIKVHGGEVVSFEETVSVKGTKIVISDLFYNTPVRAKFLRKEKTEENAVTDYVEKLILSYPEISFKYVINGKTRYQTTGSGLLDNIYTIYGKETASSLIEIKQEVDDYVLWGYIGKPEIARSTKNFQTLFVRGRYVKNATVAVAVSNAYDEFLMKQKFPFYVLNISLPPESLDVNIHPNKLEVKFEKNAFIYNLFYTTVSRALLMANHTRQVPIETDEKPIEKPNIEIQPLELDIGVSFGDEIKEEKQESKKDDASFKTDLHLQPVDQKQVNFREYNILDKLEDKTQKTEEINKVENKTQYVKDILPENQIEKPFEQVENFDKLEIIGSLFKTYIVVERKDDVILIDQHAAHERILYDKFMIELQNQNSIKQELLLPYNFSVSDKELEILKDNFDILSDFGFELAEYGFNIIKVSAVPYILIDMDIKAFIDDLIANIGELYKKPIDSLKDFVAKKACKAAVKGGQKLSESEIKIILNLMQNGILQCPHGRPFVLSVSKTKLDKLFKRIV